MKSLAAAILLTLSSILLSACTSWEQDHCPSLVEADGTLDLPRIQSTMGGDMPVSLRGPVYQSAHPRASQQAIDDDLRQRKACQEFRGLKAGPKRDAKQRAYVNAQLSVFAEGLKGNLKPGETAAAAIVQSPPTPAPATSGWYGFSLSSSMDRDAELKGKVGNFSRLPGNGTFIQLCSSVGLVCDKVTDWEGTPQACDENPNDGNRLAYCQSRV